MRLTNLRTAFTAMIMPIVLLATAQPAPHQMIQTDSWQVSVNEMEQHRRERITTVAEELQEAGMTRSFGTDILKAVGFSAISTLVARKVAHAAVGEHFVPLFHLAYRPA